VCGEREYRNEHGLPRKAICYTTIDGIRAVLFKECGGWVGQCLEQDIAAQADTEEGVKVALEQQMEGYDLLRAPRPRAAPKMFFDLWEASK